MAKNQKQNNSVLELVLLFMILMISFLIWDTYFIYPIKLFVVLLHEAGHGISAILSGGKIVTLSIGLDLSGKCETYGGNNIFIATSGYLGSLLFGLTIFYSTHNKKIGKLFLVLISILILLISITSMQSITFMLLAIFFSLLLLSSAFFLNNKIVSFLLRSFGLLSCVYVLFDIKDDILSRSTSISDASILSNLINVPVLWIGVSWLIISIAGIFIVMKISYMKKIK